MKQKIHLACNVMKAQNICNALKEQEAELNKPSQEYISPKNTPSTSSAASAGSVTYPISPTNTIYNGNMTSSTSSATSISPINTIYNGNMTSSTSSATSISPINTIYNGNMTSSTSSATSISPTNTIYNGNMTSSTSSATSISPTNTIYNGSVGNAKLPYDNSKSIINVTKGIFDYLGSTIQHLIFNKTNNENSSVKLPLTNGTEVISGNTSAVVKPLSSSSNDAFIQHLKDACIIGSIKDNICIDLYKPTASEVGASYQPISGTNHTVHPDNNLIVPTNTTYTGPVGNAATNVINTETSPDYVEINVTNTSTSVESFVTFGDPNYKRICDVNLCYSIHNDNLTNKYSNNSFDMLIGQTPEFSYTTGNGDL